MMMQMLAAGGMPTLIDGVRTPDADNPRGYFELEAVKATRRDASWTRDAVGRAVKVIHVLVSALPPGREYRLIWMRRRLEEVVASQQAPLARGVGRRIGGFKGRGFASVHRELHGGLPVHPERFK